MMENPYESSNADPAESSTPESSTPGASDRVGTFRDAIVFTLVQQLPLLLLSAMILDGGLVFKRVAIASLAFWILTLIIMLRRGRNIAKSDLLFIKWGYLPILLATCVLWMVASAIMP